MDIDSYFTKIGTVNTAKIRILSNEEVEYIEFRTSFLQLNPKISSRIRVLKAGIIEHPKCPCCDNYLKFSSSKKSIFVEYCSISCAKKHRSSLETVKKFKNTLDQKNKEYEIIYENSIIEPKEIVIEFFKDNFDTFKGGGSRGKKLLITNPNMHKSLMNYTTSKKLNARIYELIYEIGKCKECDILTNFKSLDGGFYDYCEEHGKKNTNGSITKGLNSISKAIEKLKTFDNFSEFEIVNVPNKLNGLITLKHSVCGEDFDLFLGNGKIQNYILRCSKCQSKSISSPELEIKNWIESKNIRCISQYKVGNKKIDLYLPDYNLAIEYHGLMFHSYGKSGYSMFNNHLSENKNRHLERLELCQSNNIQLLQIFENEWYNPIKKDIWLSTISSKLMLNQRIFARKCKIVKVNKTDTDNFLTNNHLQGYTNFSYSFGLEYNGELVSIITIGKSRFSGKYDWEILRYCNKKYTNIIGGFSKLLKHFNKNYQGTVISYANKRWSDGNLYEQNNFTLLHESSPNYFYFLDKKTTLYSRNQFQKHKLKDKLEKFDPILTEKENMFNNGYRRIWDCGNKVYTLKVKE